MGEPFVGDLQIDQDLRWQRKGWRIQRIGWLGLVLFLIAAAAGVFGGYGPLREAQAGPADAVVYDRYTRFGSPTEMSVDPPPEAVDRGKVEVAVARDYLADFAVASVTPQPDSVRVSADELIYTFLAATDPAPVDFVLTPRQAGVQSAEVRIGEDDAITFTQAVYP